MDDFDITPFPVQVLSNQPAMTAVGFVLAAQQASVGNCPFYSPFPDAPLVHKSEKLAFVGLPVVMFLPLSVQHIFRRCQFRQMDVFHPADFVQKIFQVILLGKS